VAAGAAALQWRTPQAPAVVCGGEEMQACRGGAAKGRGSKGQACRKGKRAANKAAACGEQGCSADTPPWCAASGAAVAEQPTPRRTRGDDVLVCACHACCVWVCGVQIIARRQVLQLACCC
jgi:hypothetical protein